MAETKTIQTFTSLSVLGSSIAIKTEYFEPPNTILARITDDVGIQDGVSFEEGQLLIQMVNNPDQIDYYLDSNGNLILLNATGDEDNYDIDSNGELVYTTID